MMGRTIDDQVESGRGTVPGLGWLPATTHFEVDKITRQRRGRAHSHQVTGYQIHHGVTVADGGETWITLDDAYGTAPDGVECGLADAVEAHLDMRRLEALIASARP